MSNYYVNCKEALGFPTTMQLSATDLKGLDVLVALIDAQVFAYMGQLEFFYDQVPDNMQSIGTALFTSNTGVAHFLCTAILHIVTSVTGRNGHQAWVGSSINNSRLDKYYWMLTALSAVNFLAFLAVSQWYTYKVATRPARADQKKVMPEKAAPMVEWYTVRCYLGQHIVMKILKKLHVSYASWSRSVKSYVGLTFWHSKCWTRHHTTVFKLVPGAPQQPGNMGLSLAIQWMMEGVWKP